MRCALRRSVIPRADPASRSPLTRPFPTSPLRFRSKPAYVPPHLRNRPAGDRDRDRGGFDRRDDRRGGGACPIPIGCLFSTQPDTAEKTGARTAERRAARRPRHRGGDAPIAPGPRGFGSHRGFTIQSPDAGAPARVAAAVARAFPRATCTGNPKLARAPRAPRVWNHRFFSRFFPSSTTTTTRFEI